MVVCCLSSAPPRFASNRVFQATGPDKDGSLVNFKLQNVINVMDTLRSIVSGGSHVPSHL